MPPAFDRPEFHRRAAILAVGDELVLGQKLDTNSAWLADALLTLGIRPTTHTTVEDQLSQIIEAIESLAYENDLIVITGGLGPTDDDLTREALAEVLEQPLVESPESLAQLQAWAAARSSALNEHNRRQALRPKTAVALPNPRGTAPGLAAVMPPDHELERTHHVLVVALPGPPSENQPMFREQVVPMLRPPTNRVVRTRSLSHVGLAESVTGQRLGELMMRSTNPAVGTTASGGIVTVRVRYEGEPARADAAIADVLAQVRAKLAPHGFGWCDEALGLDDNATLPEVVLGYLVQREQTLVVAESCTGGMLGAQLTTVPGAARAFLGGWQTYANSMKRACLGVPAELIDHPGSPAYRGAVSKECAIAMAEGALRASAATGQPAHHALAITGIAGPDGGSPDKPVGTVWIARASHSPSPDPAAEAGALDVEARRFLITGGREMVRSSSCTMALAMLLLHLRSDRVERLTWQVAE